MSRKFLGIFVLVVVVLVGLGVWLGVSLLGDKDSDYSAVVMSNGEIYFGKLSWFPSAHLEGAWVLQRGVDANNQAQLSVIPVNKAFWSPADDLYLNTKQIISWSKLTSESQLVKAFANPESFQGQGQAAPVPQQPVTEE